MNVMATAIARAAQASNQPRQVDDVEARRLYSLGMVKRALSLADDEFALEISRKEGLVGEALKIAERMGERGLMIKICDESRNKQWLGYAGYLFEEWAREARMANDTNHMLSYQKLAVTYYVNAEWFINAGRLDREIASYLVDEGERKVHLDRAVSFFDREIVKQQEAGNLEAAGDAAREKGDERQALGFYSLLIDNLRYAGRDDSVVDIMRFKLGDLKGAREYFEKKIEERVDEGRPLDDSSIAERMGDNMLASQLRRKQLDLYKGRGSDWKMDADNLERQITLETLEAVQRVIKWRLSSSMPGMVHIWSRARRNDASSQGIRP